MGRLDTRKSITILAWIYHQGRAGPIFNYNPRAWGVHFWMIAPRTLFVRFTRRPTRGFTAALLSRSVTPNKWQYVGTTYDYSSGVAKLFVNGVNVAHKRIGRIRLATNYPVRMGARIGDRRYFRGRISCLQVYSVALTANQIASRSRRCFVKALPRPRPPRPSRTPYRSAGCWRDKSRRVVGTRVANFRGRADAVMRCFVLARARGYRVFAVQYGGECWTGPNAHRTYTKYGRTRGCRNGKGGAWANNVYFIMRTGGAQVIRPPRPVRPRPALPVCRAHIDLGFVVDGSSSVGKKNFVRCINFVRDLVSSFTIHSRFTRVGIIVYNTRPIPQFSFGRYKDKNALINNIGRIRYPRGGTKTGRALHYARGYLYGMSKRRKVLVVITDGRSYDHVRAPARALRRMGVEVFAVGVGRRYNSRQLMQIAYNRRHVFTSGFRNLVSLVRAIKQKACTGLPPKPHSPPKGLRPVAVFPLSLSYKGRELQRRNRPGKLVNVRPAPGPDQRAHGSYYFYGRANSYIEIPNSGKLDTGSSITILSWIYHQGSAGPIVHYMPNGWGVHLWMVTARTLFVRFSKRGTRQFTPALTSKRVKPHTWQFVGASYDRKSGVAKLYINSRVVAQRHIGRIRLATNYPVRLGAKIGDRRYFRGRISCVQVYRQALPTSVIGGMAASCFRGGISLPLPKPKPGGRVCTTKMDLGFVIDGSSSIEHYGKGNFKRCLRFIKNLVNVFTISRKFTRVGIVLYSSRPYKIFGFDRYGNKHKLLRAVSRIRYPRGGTRTGRALRYAQRYLFGRSKSRKVLIVMTDGKSHDKVRRPAQSLRRRGINILVLGIGKKYNGRQLNMMASSRGNVYTSGFRNLASVVRVLKRKACGRSGQPSSAYTSKVRPVHTRFAYHWLGCYTDRANRAITRMVFSGKRDPVGKCAALAHRRRYKVFAIENGQECFTGRLAHKTFNRYGPSTKCRKGRGGSWAMDVYRLGKSVYKPVKKPNRGSAVTWRIQRVGCFKDRRRRAAVGRMIVNLKRVKNAVMKCFRQARKLGYKLFAVQDGGKCFAGPRGHLTYSKYGRSHRCRSGMGGKWAINVYRFSKCAGGRCARPRPPRPFPRPIPVPRSTGKACRARVDLGILIDGSGSIEYYGKGNFRRCLNFVQRIVSSFTISSAYTRVGVILFSRRPHLIFGFSRYGKKFSLLKAIRRIRYPRGGTLTGRALRFARRRLFSQSRGRRKVLIIMTDGRSQDHVSRPAQKLRRHGVQIFPLGIGKHYNKRQLLRMAGNRRHVFFAGFRSLNTVVRVIKRRVCRGGAKISSKRGRKVRISSRGRHGKIRRRFRKRRPKRRRRFGKRRRKVHIRRHRKRRGKMRGASGRNKKQMRHFGRRRKKMAGKWMRRQNMKGTAGRRRRTRGRFGKRGWRTRRVGGQWRKTKGGIRKGGWKIRKTGGRKIKMKGRIRKGGRKKRVVGGRWRKMKGKLRKGGRKLVRTKSRSRRIFRRRPVRRRKKKQGRRGKIRGRRGKRNRIEHKAPSPVPTVDLYWAFQLSKNTTTLDLKHSRAAHLEGGASVLESPKMGLVANTEKSNRGWISLGDFRGQCFSDPNKCKHKGLTFMSWIKLHKELKPTSSYVLSSGGQTTKARGLALLHLANRYILLLSTKERQWKVETPNLPRDWFNLAFTWKSNGTLQLFVNGSPVAHAAAVAVSRPQDLFTTFVIGRPNNAEHPQYRMPLEIQSVALWERSLTETELRHLIHSVVPKRSSNQDRPN